MADKKWEMKKMSKRMEEIAAKHWRCFGIGFFIVLVAIITIFAGKDKDYVSHINLSTSLTAIILSLVVIMYAWYADARSERNSEKMRDLIRGIEESTKELARGQNEIKDAMNKPGNQDAKAEQGKKYILDRASATGLLVLKWIALTEKHEDKESNIEICAKQMGLSTDTYILGFLAGFLAWEWAGEVNIENKVFKKIKLPKEFKDDVEKAINKKILEFNELPIAKMKTEWAKQNIEKYFE